MEPGLGLGLGCTDPDASFHLLSEVERQRRKETTRSCQLKSYPVYACHAPVLLHELARTFVRTLFGATFSQTTIVRVIVRLKSNTLFVRRSSSELQSSSSVILACSANHCPRISHLAQPCLSTLHLGEDDTIWLPPPAS